MVEEEKMNRKKVIMGIFIVLFAGLLLAPGPLTGPVSAKTVQLSMGCGPSVASGYPAGVALSKFLNDRIKGLQLVPIELGTAAAIRRLSAGEMDLTYSNAFDVVASYNNEGAFKKNPLKPGTQPEQGIWFWPVAQFMVTRADTNIHSLNDLKGRTVSLGSPKEGLYAFAKDAFDAMGLTKQWTERITQGDDRAQALKSGNVDALLAVVNAMNTLAGHTMQVELYNKLRALTMTKEQEDIIKKTPGISLVWVPSKLFKENMGMDMIPAIGNVYGWSFSPSVDPEIVYQFVKTCFENADKLVQLARVFEMFSKDPKGTVAMGLNSASKAPIHPGAARYYKEIGIWNNSWVVGKSQ
jgi:TRAP transporter TAXI family solute receptor